MAEIRVRALVARLEPTGRCEGTRREMLVTYCVEPGGFSSRWLTRREWHGLEQPPVAVGQAVWLAPEAARESLRWQPRSADGPEMGEFRP